jgi:23S rRNA pseudouridine1911/1915/1917 synthase
MKAFKFIVDETEAGSRLDKWLSMQLPDVSRSYIQKLIKNNYALVNHVIEKASFKLEGGDSVEIELPEVTPWHIKPEKKELDILYEDDDLLILNKEAGLVVHPAPGHKNGTLVNYLLYYCRGLSSIGGILRPGIVHRLDQGTSGVLVVAKNDFTHNGLSRQFQKHTITREYIALVFGNVTPKKGKIEKNIGRSHRDRKKMAAISGGKHAVTEWEVINNFRELSLIKLTLRTGRTHQIRVHLSDSGWSVVGDFVYGGGAKRIASIKKKEIRDILKKIDHPLLHARRLAFTHPRLEKIIDISSEPPEDFKTVLGVLNDEKG